MVTNSTDNVTSTASQNITTFIASGVLTTLCTGEYTVVVFISYNETFIDYNLNISQTIVTVNGTNCRTISIDSKQPKINNILN